MRPRLEVESPYLNYLNDKFRFPRSLVHKPIQRFFRRYLLSAPDGTRVLDAGCGNGIETGPHADRLRVVGIDYQPTYIAHASASYPDASFVVATLSRLGIADSSADLIVMNQVIEHLESPAVVVAELARVLSPGGRLLVATPNYGGFGWPFVEATYHRWFAKEFDAEEAHVTPYRKETLAADLASALTVEHAGTICAGLILVAAARKVDNRDK